MEADLKRHILACAAALSAHRKQALVTISRLATGDWRFFDRIESGCSFTARKYDATMAWFSANWPEDLAWPDDVPRPATTQQAA
ncbi:hypothetical protein J2X45_003908 [Caulobacter sp. BE264]|uniref:hypothetical protein n=1 Tax=Caulobacter sp. BE264 TaxID=2817724 RepID=UPI00285AD0A6|nr:hypothetical protein [Caulobacter sp. BE264]MDR7232798.1 hypothetical protein [Caulobacter sp. BE264]